MFRIVCWCLLIVCPFNGFGLNQIIDLRVYPHATHCRLVFDTTEPSRYQQFTLRNPDRIVVDIKSAHLVRYIERPMLHGSPINDIRNGRKENNTLRIVFDLKHSVKTHFFTLKPDRNKPYHRLVMDLSWAQAATVATQEKPRYLTVYEAKAVAANPKPVNSVATVKRSPSIIVVIDPGHGGRDPGAVGPGGAHEKNVVMNIARYVEQNLNRQPGFKAYLTRKGDYYLTLRQRLAIARQYGADMFIAIHADAYYKDRSAYGASVFALSQRGATSEAARWLAKKENESELMGGVDLADKTNLLKSVLINLSQTATIRASLRIGQRIIQSLDDVGRLHHRRVEQAAFVVLKSPDIPSLLVETGFISNPREERNLLNPAYQRRIASAITQGIHSYFIYQPPPGTWLAQRKFRIP